MTQITNLKGFASAADPFFWGRWTSGAMSDRREHVACSSIVRSLDQVTGHLLKWLVYVSEYPCKVVPLFITICLKCVCRDVGVFTYFAVTSDNQWTGRCFWFHFLARVQAARYRNCNRRFLSFGKHVWLVTITGDVRHSQQAGYSYPVVKSKLHGVGMAN